MNLAPFLTSHPADRVALVHHDRVVTYGELAVGAAAVRAGLLARGVGVGDRVVCTCGNEPEFVFAYLGTIGCGAVFVPLNPASPPAELEREESVVGPSLVLNNAAAVADLMGADHDATDVAAVDDACTAVLLFTSGTAGTPRAAMLSHGNLRANLEQSAALPGGVRADDVVFGVLPLFHVFGLNVILGLTLAGGAQLVLVDRFDPLAALAAIAAHRITVVAGAPPMWHAWAHLGDVDGNPMATVRLGLSGADRLPGSTYELIQQRFGVRIREGYGLTEASPTVTSSLGTDAPPGSIGRPLPGIEIRVVDDDGDDVFVDDPGEIWVRGPNVFQGYWGDPEATARALTGRGWLRTGDLAVVDEEGTLRIVDRAKDLIIVSGFNVHPAEVEAIILEFPGVVDVGVVGVPDERSGETIKAFVVLAPGVAPDAAALLAHCTHEMAR
ncbi:MAG: long-chain acyl-CoA synthetase, partial [Acidimicrobiaceae bacterium]|nr:long-chain acyl-CoA synthetase [Acidimicrobiaceae bacterium]